MMNKPTILMLTITILLFGPVMAFTYPDDPIVDGIFTGFDPVLDSFNEYESAAADESIGGEFPGQL